MGELGDNTGWEVAAAVNLNQNLTTLAAEFADLAERFRDYDDPATMTSIVHTPVGYGDSVMLVYVLKGSENG